MFNAENIVGVFLGLSLASAVGFRIFIPLLIMSLASMSGFLSLSSGFEWIGTFPALVILGAAAVFELAAYFIPYVDNILDTIAGPVAVIAGTIVMASSIVEMEPLYKWIIAIIAGGGAAGLVQSLTTITRGASTITTGGIGNHLVATGETSASVGISVLAIIFPIGIGVLILLFLFWVTKKVYIKFFK
ncbi:MAG: DUF4126 domain-containing protein [Ignavibacteriae bacterium]|nr:DUF4126 domain-containing protein [Ignavibacteriota bacterium]MCB9208430.1 DUF4126 domain-containing protein [Ignavibacteriales bacterium]MCB9258462.1 DUF4126 domain-containing protein [Ignavibacteriales bacterium]